MNADFSFELPGNQVLTPGRCISLMALRSGRAYDLQAWLAAATSSPRGSRPFIRDGAIGHIARSHARAYRMSESTGC